MKPRLPWRRRALLLFSLLVFLAVSTGRAADSLSAPSSDDEVFFSPATLPTEDPLTPLAPPQAHSRAADLSLFSEAPPEAPDEASDVDTFKRTDFFGDLSRKFMVIIQQRPWFFDEDQIDKIIGDPWTLQPTTAAKLRFLHPRLRMEFYNAILERLESFNITPDPAARTQVPLPGQAPVTVGLDRDASNFLLNRMQRGFMSNFRTEELVDLGVFLLSKFRFFPKNIEDWRKLRHTIVNLDLALGTAFLIGAIATRQGTVSATGWLVRLPGDTFRIGWYGSLNGFGLNPFDGWDVSLRRVRGGVAFGSRDLEAKAGYYYKPKANPDEIKRGLELNFKEHWLQLMSQRLGFGWQLAATGGVTYILEHGSEERNGTWDVHGEMFARKEALFGNPGIAFSGRAQGSTSFEGHRVGSTTLGLEDMRRDLGVYFRVGEQIDPILGKDDRSIRFLVGGSIESSERLLREHLRSLAGLIQNGLEYLTNRRADLKAYEQRLDAFGTGELSPEEERKLVRGLSLRESWISGGVNDLRRLLEAYLEARQQYYTVHKRLRPSQITDAVGPLPTELLRAARAESLSLEFQEPVRQTEN